MKLIIGVLLAITACAANLPPQAAVDSNSVVLYQFDYEVDSVAFFFIEQSLNSDELKQYYHFEIPERQSMQLVLNTTSPLSNVSIKCFGRQVEIVKNVSSSKHPRALELLEIHHNDSGAFLNFRYGIEGISFKVVFEYVDKKWTKRSINIVEN